MDILNIRFLSSSYKLLLICIKSHKLTRYYRKKNTEIISKGGDIEPPKSDKKSFKKNEHSTAKNNDLNGIAQN